MPRTILILSSTPRDLAPLRVHEEVREIEDAIRRARRRDEYQVVVRLGIRARDVHRVLLEHRPAIVHFSGHGRGAQGLMLEDDHGDSLPVSSADLARMLGHFRDDIACVVINSCHSEAQVHEIAERIPFVIGMERALDDRAAISFAMAFYECVANGESIPSAFEVACSAVSLDGLALDRVAVLAGRGLVAGASRGGIARPRKRALTAGLAMGVMGAVAFAASRQRPAVSVPALPASGGVVVAGGRLDPADMDAWQHLCATLRELGEQGVRCIAPPAASEDALIAAARAARASLVVTIEPGPLARVLPVPGRDGAQLLHGLPAISIARPETRTALARILDALAHGPQHAPSAAAARLPIEPERAMPWRVTALAALARLWTHATWDARDRAMLSEIARRCRARASLADAHCALVHYVLYAEIAPDDAGAGAWLDGVVARGPRGIADMAALHVLGRRCAEDPARTGQALLALAERLHGCERWYLMAPATCVLAAGGQGSADAAVIRALAEPDEHAGEPCPDQVRAGAYYERAHWLAETRHASTREEWEHAVESYEQAFRLDPRADHAHGLAEALLFLRRRDPDRSDEIAQSVVEVLDSAAVDEPTAVFLAWMSGDAEDPGALARLCAIYREMVPGEVAVPHVSRRLACPGGEGDDSLACSAYRLLSAPRPAAGGALAASVCAADNPRMLSRAAQP